MTAFWLPPGYEGYEVARQPSPEEFYAAYGASLAEGRPLTGTNFCLGCDCAQDGDAALPCWNCAGETQREKPAYWPGAFACPQRVIAGESYTVGVDTDGPDGDNGK